MQRRAPSQRERLQEYVRGLNTLPSLVSSTKCIKSSRTQPTKVAKSRRPRTVPVGALSRSEPGGPRRVAPRCPLAACETRPARDQQSRAPKAPPEAHWHVPNTPSPRRRRPDGAERARPPAARDVRSPTRDSQLTSRIKLSELPMAAGTAVQVRETGAASLMAGHKHHQDDSPLLHK